MGEIWKNKTNKKERKKAGMEEIRGGGLKTEKNGKKNVINKKARMETKRQKGVQTTRKDGYKKKAQ
jgi:hypothetical protein